MIECGIVTGAAGFLGPVHSKSILDLYQGLVIVDIDRKKLELAFKNLVIDYPKKKILKFNLDITKENQIKKLEKKIRENFFFARVLINNAAIDPKPSEINKKNLNWDRELDVGLKAAYLLIKYFSKQMIKKKDGCIINIASDLSIIAPTQSIYKNSYRNFIKPVTYSVIKHGLIGLTKYYAALYGEYNITCNAISPVGVFNNQDKKFVKKLSNLIPMKRMANKSDIKNVIDFLINKNQRFVTGQNIAIDGGRTIV
jgi:NAD(P)-dependent dehydrogenase (short-subunit alcohol dehydrogenase family)